MSESFICLELADAFKVVIVWTLMVLAGDSIDFLSYLVLTTIYTSMLADKHWHIDVTSRCGKLFCAVNTLFKKYIMFS